MIVVFETKSGSRYEVDAEAKKIRRVSGVKPPQPRQGSDGQWMPYLAISEIETGRVLVVSWPDSVPLLEGSPFGARPATITSPIIRCAVLS